MEWTRRNPDLADALGEGEVHVWRASVPSLVKRIEEFRRIMPADELARADRYRHMEDRVRFLTGRGWLRHLASQYLAFGPEPIPFRLQVGRHGKPFAIGLQFNLSHSSDYVVMAFSKTIRLGVDVERMNRKVDVMGLASEMCTADESAMLALLEGEARPHAFYRLWVKKEAFLKASGEGFSRAPREVRANQLPWPSFELELDGEYAAALVTDTPPATLGLFSVD